MKVRVEDIPEHRALTINGDIPVPCGEMDSSDIEFIDKIYLDCIFSRVGKEILLKAKVVVHWRIVCSRCLERKEQVINQEYTLSYNTANLGEYLEIDKDIREEVLLNFPMRAFCRSDCKGLCPGCGVNLNIEVCRCGGVDIGKESNKN